MNDGEKKVLEMAEGDQELEQGRTCTAKGVAAESEETAISSKKNGKVIGGYYPLSLLSIFHYFRPFFFFFGGFYLMG